MYGKSASLWLAEMERHRQTESSPSMYLQLIDRHLYGEAAKWVLNTPSVRALIYKGYMGLASDFDIDALHLALIGHFKLTPEEVQNINTTTLVYRLRFLKQGAGEGLEQYYTRAQKLLLELNGRDGENNTLTPPEISLRTIVVESFITGLSSKTLHDWLCQRVLHHTTSLHRALKMAEAHFIITGLKIKAKDSKGKEKEESNKNKKRKVNMHDNVR